MNNQDKKDQNNPPQPSQAKSRHEYTCPTHGVTIAKGGQCGSCVQGPEMTKKVVDDSDMFK